MNTKQLYVDTYKVTKLIRRTNLYTWLLCIDKVTRKVSTYDYDRREQFMISVK